MSRTRIGAALAVAAAIATVAGAAPANAALGPAANQTVTFTNQASVAVSLNPSAFGFGSVSPLTPAVSPAGGNTATVYSNSTWHLQVAGTGNFTDSSGNTIPDGRMTISANGGGPQALSSGATGIANGTATPQTGTAVPLVYTLTLLWSDPIGTSSFSDTLTYTAVTP